VELYPTAKTFSGRLAEVATKNILIVEDNEHLRQILAKIVRFHGYKISETTTGTQAIKKALFAKPDLIFLDMGLPDMSGIEAGRAIRRNPVTSHIPIIACSASLSEENREEALRAGMDDYLLKPMSAALIKAKIEEHIVAKDKYISNEVILRDLSRDWHFDDWH
jgi:CheY-like chemotaxis protein